METVVVTGSRIAQPNLTTTSPVTQVTAADITTAGVTRVEDLVNQLPQAFAAQNATVSNGATGTATVDLRGLGSPRTLVLVDGRRMPYGGVTNSAADLNQIPTMMVERVEILTGGASAVYGSDAVSGVVNFIMKRNFTGVQVDAQYNFYQHNNSYGGPGAVKLVRRDRVPAVDQPVAVPAARQQRDRRLRPPGLHHGRRRHGRRPRQHHGLRHHPQERRDPAGQPRLLSLLALDDYADRFVWRPDRQRRPRCGGSGTAYPGTFTDFSTYNFTVDSATGNTFRNFVEFRRISTISDR